MIVTLLLFPCLILSIIPIALSDVCVYNSADKFIEDYDDQPANFPPAFPSDGIKGYVSLTNPRNACTKIAPPPNISIAEYRWIALIPRTNSADMCDFDLKVLNAQNANFSAVIIYNYEDVLITMGSHGRDVKIPSTLITHSDGLSIISKYLFNKTSIKSTPQFHIRIVSESAFKFGSYVIPFICIISISFLGLICFTLVKCYLHRRRTRRHRLPRSALKQLKIKKFVKGDHWEVCAICLDDFVDGAKLRILPCDHAYHMKCIDPWLLNSRRQCPVCKRYVFPNQENSDDEDNNGQATTEQTPLIQPVDNDLANIISRNRQRDHRNINPSRTGASNVTHNIGESSDTDDDDDDDDDYDDPSSIERRTTTNPITAMDIVFDRSTSNSQRYPHVQSPQIVIRQSSFNENDQNNLTTTTTYGSLHDSTPASFTIQRASNFIIDSNDDTTDATNISTRSVIENASDTETDDNDERMHSVLTDVEINHGYVPDDETSNSSPTNV